MMLTWLAGVWAQFPQRKLTFQVHCCIWRKVFCICFDVDFSYIHGLSCCWEYPQMLQGKNLLQAVPFAAKDQGTLPSLSKKWCFLSSSQRMTVDVTQRTFKLEKWIAWRKQTFGESLRSLKLEIILGWIKREETVYTWYAMYFYKREDELITTSPDSHLWNSKNA